VEAILAGKSADNSDAVANVDPELLRPPARHGHFEQNRALNKAVENWLPILVHGRTELQLHHTRVVRLPLVELHSEECVDERLFLEGGAVGSLFAVLLDGGGLGYHGLEKLWAHFLHPFFVFIINFITAA